MSIQLIEIRELLKTLIEKKTTGLTEDAHIKAGMKWLCLAQDATPDGGVSIRFSLLRGWESSYPETTGYIIPTFFKYYEITGDELFKERALRMAEWELSIQQEDGSFIGGALQNGVGKLVFDTGQILFGLLEAFRYSKEDAYINAARSAGDWLLQVQDPDGAWRQFVYHSIPHTYYSRVAWPLVKLYKATGEEKYLDGARKNIDWVLSNQTENGWFSNSGFTLENNKSPYTHTIAYTVRGLLESGILLDEERYISAAKRTADKLLEIMHPEGFFWGRYDNEWQRNGRFSCLTGNAQISIILLKLYQATNNAEYVNGASALNGYLKRKQNVTTENGNIRGAIAGSYPLWGEYGRLSYPNWATKFFVDALMLERELATDSHR